MVDVRSLTSTFKFFPLPQGRGEKEFECAGEEADSFPTPDIFGSIQNCPGWGSCPLPNGRGSLCTQHHNNQSLREPRNSNKI